MKRMPSKKVAAPMVLDAAGLGTVAAGAVAINPIYKPQPDPWIPVVTVPIVIITLPVGY